MPVVTIKVPARALDKEQKARMVQLVTDAVVEAEGFPQVRPSVHVLIEEIPDGGYGIGGRAIDVDAVKAALARKSA
jgi:4-oxalocrotonate tautomerase